MPTINITNSTVTITINDEKLSVNTNNPVDKTPSKNQHKETPIADEHTSKDKQMFQHAFVPVSDTTTPFATTQLYSNSFNETPQGMPHLPYVGYINRHWPIDSIYKSQQQRISNFANYPVNVDNFTPHYDKSIRVNITDKMLLNALRHIPNSIIGDTKGDSIVIKDIIETTFTTTTVKLAFLENAPIGATIFVKLYNTKINKLVYNNWTKIENNGWKVNATIYEAIDLQVVSF